MDNLTFRSTRAPVAIIGEPFRDVYWTGTSTRQSPEAPVPVVKIESIAAFPGGAENVLLNYKALGLGCKTFIAPQTLPVKNRLISGGIQIARWDEKDYHRPIDTMRIHDELGSILPKAVIISDYGKGAFTPEVIRVIDRYSWDYNIRLYIDTKQPPGLWLPNPLVTFFPNAAEMAQFKDDYQAHGAYVYKQGSSGLQYYQDGQLITSCRAFNPSPVNVSGAGDTILAAWVYAAENLIDPTPAQIARFASAAAAVTISKPFTATASLPEITEVLCKNR